MTRYDVFNGDADGICALHQLRLDEPRDAELVTGVKRDIGLVARINAQVLVELFQDWAIKGTRVSGSQTVVELLARIASGPQYRRGPR